MRTKSKNTLAEEKMVFNTVDVVSGLAMLLEEPEYKKKEPSPKFTIQEFRFLRDMIFNKPKGLLFFYLADHMMNNTMLHKLPMLNAPSIKKLRFFYNFLGRGGNATQAAIRAGYSPKTAKQQGHRILRQIQSYSREE